jgi:hypothetical protein
MKRLVLVVFLTATGGCSPHVEAPAAPRLAASEIVGRYGSSGPIGYLTLEPDGEYECLVLNGVTVDGCGTFVGSGLSKGTWAIGGEAVSFTPTAEPPDLVLELATASATPSDGGLLLVVKGDEHQLAREPAWGEPDQRQDKPMSRKRAIVVEAEGPDDRSNSVKAHREAGTPCRSPIAHVDPVSPCWQRRSALR